MKKFVPGLMPTFPLMQKLIAYNTLFTWNDNFQAELDSMKTDMKQNITLSPLDTSKKIYGYTDATPTA